MNNSMTATIEQPNTVIENSNRVPVETVAAQENIPEKESTNLEGIIEVGGRDTVVTLPKVEVSEKNIPVSVRKISYGFDLVGLGKDDVEIGAIKALKEKIEGLTPSVD